MEIILERDYWNSIFEDHSGEYETERFQCMTFLGKYYVIESN